MNKTFSAWSVLVLGLLMIAFLAGCGGVSANTPSPTPTPTPNPSPTPPGATPTPTPAAHGTFVFVNGVNAPGQPTDTYRLNPDGTLTLATGSPFPVSGMLASSGSFLAVASGNSITSYRVDATTGVPTAAGNAQVNASAAVAADAHDIYVAGKSADNANWVIYGFSIGGIGLLTPLPGSPFQLIGACDLCNQPVSMAINNSFVVVGTSGFQGAGAIAVLPRAANGTLGAPQLGGSSEQGAVAVQPNGNSAFSIDESLGAIDSWALDAAGHPTAGPGVPPSATLDFIDQVVDPTGKFLLALDTTGVVHIFTIGANAALSQIGTSESVGSGADRIAIDPSGRFVIVVQENPDQLTVFTFDPSSAAMKKLPGTFPVGKLSVHIAILSE
ncbi:MAG TPA: beta-propeller fold lactonase family protein [Candidatus Angelobacter sp.]|jgi:Lactonase, 7-bladed beta-propeller|nr:beta-propeller fold lactonase family protein [Candidatus Angelobacter sp.]